MRFQITILGSSAALPTVSRNHSAQLLNIHEQYYLVDCGEGAQQQMMRNGVSPVKLNAIFISHLHGDHFFGVLPLISTMAMLGRRKALEVFAPHPFREIVDFHIEHLALELPFELIINEIDTSQAGVIYENKVIEVTTVPLRHRVPTVGYMFREKQPPLNIRKDSVELYGLEIDQILAAKKGADIVVAEEVIPNNKLTYRPYGSRSYAYLSDTNYSAKAAKTVKGVDILYHEATFAEEEKALAKQTGHSTTCQAAKAAIISEAKLLIIGHFSSRYKDLSTLLEQARNVFPACELAEENRTYEIAPKLNR